jgi:intermembrane space import and assembly protein 40
MHHFHFQATGPCGVEFREAFSCFHYSEAEPKGTDCYDAFKTMQECMANYPTVYNQNLDDDKEGGGMPGLDMSGLDDDDDEEDEESHAEYADGDEDESKTSSKAVAVANK